MNLSKLHLEKIKIPKNIKSKMEDDVWECYDYEHFIINVSYVLHNGKENLSYSLEFSPTDEIFEDINKKLEQQKYIADGYGWTEFINKKLTKNKVQFTDEIGNDSESETFVLYSNNENDFKILLHHFSDYFRELSTSKNDIKEEPERTISISRFWEQKDEDDDIDKAELMLRRPRIDFRVSEYIWEFIEINLLATKNILQKNSLDITLFLGPIKKTHKFFYGSEYDTEIRKFHPHFKGNKLKDINIFCSYNGFSKTMLPVEYANVIYDMCCSFIVDNFKKVTKQECDEIKTKMDYNLINSFEFPAYFDNQKYSRDEGGYGGRTIDFVPDPKAKPYIFREAYLEHYGK